MVRKSLSTLLFVLAAAAPAAARAAGPLSVGLELHGGLQKYDALGLKHGLDQDVRVSRRALLDDTSKHVGATVIVNIQSFELGAIGELGRPGSSPETTVLGGLVGFGTKLGPVKLEALGEVGGRRYGDFLEDPAIVTKGKDATWLMYAGLRPGISIRTGAFPKLIIGVWGFARWDLTREDVPVTVTPTAGGPPIDARYELGGSEYGASLRLGIEL